MERRAKPRIQWSFPATVRGTTTFRESFEIHTNIDDLSAGGMHVRVEHPVAVPSPLFASIRLPGLEVKARGVVKRIKLQRDGSFGLGVAFESYSLLSASPDMGAPRSKTQ